LPLGHQRTVGKLPGPSQGLSEQFPVELANKNIAAFDPHVLAHSSAINVA